MADEATLGQRYLETALKQSQFLRKNDPARANREFKKLHAIKNELRRLPDRGEAILKRIILEDDVEVRIHAAAALLAVDEPFALKVLDEIASTEPGLPSLTAKMTALEWRAGRLRDYLG